MGRVLLVATLLAFLVLAIAWVAYMWTVTDVQMSGHGYFAMTVGIIISLAVGIGLMALVYASGRRGYDR